MEGTETAATGSVLGRDAILARKSVPLKQQRVEAFGGTVIVQEMRAREKDEYEQSMVAGKGKNQAVNIRNGRAKLVVLSVVDEAGKRIFTDADVVLLGELPVADIDRICEAAQALSAVSDEDIQNIASN